MYEIHDWTPAQPLPINLSPASIKTQHQFLQFCSTWCPDLGFSMSLQKHIHLKSCCTAQPRLSREARYIRGMSMTCYRRLTIESSALLRYRESSYCLPFATAIPQKPVLIIPPEPASASRRMAILLPPFSGYCLVRVSRVSPSGRQLTG